MFDTHCHLNSFYPSPNLSSIFHQNYTKYLAVSTEVDDWLATIEFANKSPNILPAIGIHPWNVQKSFELDLLLLKQLIAQYSISALGEIGLDFGEQFKENKAIQINCFEEQLFLALNNNLPVSLHSVKAHNEMLALLKRYEVKGVVHGLGSSTQVAQQYIDLGLKFGVNGVTVRDNARRYHELVKHFGLEHIVLETDFPNIKLPGLVDSSLDDINTVAKKVADLLKVSVEDVIEQTDYNANQLFNN